MPRVRKSKELLEALGAFKKDPSRAVDRADNPEGNGELPSCPVYLSDVGHDHWKELAAQVPAKVATGSDAGAFELMVKLFTKSRELSSLGDPSKNQGGLGGLDNKDLNTLIKLMGSFGLTPSGRAYLKVQKVEKPVENPFANLAKPVLVKK